MSNEEMIFELAKAVEILSEIIYRNLYGRVCLDDVHTLRDITSDAVYVQEKVKEREDE